MKKITLFLWFDGKAEEAMNSHFAHMELLDHRKRMFEG